MRTHTRFNLLVSITALATVLLPQRGSTFAPPTPASPMIPFSEHTIDADFNGANSVYAIDMDGDLDIDILGAATYADAITWWENDGNENFTEHTIAGSFDGAISVYAIDVDGDGDMDILGAAVSDSEITWWENDGSENFTEHTISGSFGGAASVYAIDVDGDDDIDVLGAAYTSGEITWWENDGNENFTKHTIDSSFDGACSVYATDVDGDSDIDILGAALWANDITWWENDGSENFTKHTIDSNFGGANEVYAADVDGDADIDILGVGWKFNVDNITWWENDGSESFTKHTIDDNFGGADSVYAIDVDGDSDIDILGAATIDDEITWWENDGSENFTEHTIDGSFGSAGSVYAIDVDDDGDMDVLGAALGADEITWWEQESPIWSVFLPTVLNNAGSPASAPLLDDISNSDGDGSYPVSWSSVEQAASYTLHEDDNPGFSSPTTRYTGANISKSITGMSIGTYYYRVKATNGMGSSDWSATKSVTVIIDPTPTPTPEPCADPGAWSGSTNQGHPIDFSVRNDCRVGYLTIKYWVICPPGIMVKTKTFGYSTSISDDSFDYDDDGDPTVSGHFSSQIKASGAWSSSFDYPGGPGTCSGSGSWSAYAP